MYKPVLHSWEATIMGNKAYVHRKVIKQLNRTIVKLSLPNTTFLKLKLDRLDPFSGHKNFVLGFPVLHREIGDYSLQV